jgi:hypothetical protein
MTSLINDDRLVFSFNSHELNKHRHTVQSVLPFKKVTEFL